MMNNKIITKSVSAIQIIELLLVTISYYLINFIKRGTAELDPIYVKLLILIIFSWIVVSKITKKHYVGQFNSLKTLIYRILLSNMYFMIFIALILVLTGNYELSRTQFLGTVIVSTLLDFIILPTMWKNNGNGKVENEETADDESSPNLILISIDFFIFLIAIMTFIYLVNHSFVVNLHFQKMIYIMLASWGVASFLTNKYQRKRHYPNIWHHLFNYVKAIIFMGMVTAFIQFLFHWKENKFLEFVEVYLIYGFIEIIVVSSYHIFHNGRNRETEENNITSNLLAQDELKIKTDNVLNNDMIKHSIKNDFNSLTGVLSFLNNLLQSNQINPQNIFLQDTGNLERIDDIKDESLNFYMNLNQLNDFSDINEYYKLVYKKLQPGGCICGKIRTISNDRNYIFNKYPKYLSHLIYTIYFIFVRILPQLPIYKSLYDFFTGGKRHNISKAEAFGRLYYCGYKVIAETEVDDYVYYIGQKVRTPSTNSRPSNGFLIKLKRIGKDGKKFDLYKFRTMYPYSEYLQEYVYEKNHLEKNGKINHDFRVTQWGRIMRKFWIDELPQIINLFRGDIKLFGVRALSEHYFKLYPEEVQKLRTKFKNGLIPPYYADMPNGFNEIVESEKKYLWQKTKKPILTDIKYFTKAVNNIILQGIRSK